MREDKPLCTLTATVTRDDGVVAVKGTMTTFTVPGFGMLLSMSGDG